MSKEITITEHVTYRNGLANDQFIPGTVTIDQASIGGGNPGAVNIGTSEEDVAFGDITPGLVCLQNLDPTNYVDFGPKSAGVMVQFGRLLPNGGTGRVYLPSGVTLRMKANSAPCEVDIHGFNT